MKRTSRAKGSPNYEPYRRMLLGKRASVLANLGVKFDARANMGRVGEEDQAQVSHEEFISLSLNQIDYQQLRLVEEALDRIRDGGFGECLACGDPIPERRLKAVPWARNCVPCQERAATGLVEPAEPVPTRVEAVQET